MCREKQEQYLNIFTITIFQKKIFIWALFFSIKMVQSWFVVFSDDTQHLLTDCSKTSVLFVKVLINKLSKIQQATSKCDQGSE